MAISQGVCDFLLRIAARLSRYRSKAGYHATVAQMAGRLLRKQIDVGSNPTGGHYAEMAQRQAQPPCKRQIVGSSPTFGFYLIRKRDID